MKHRRQAAWPVVLGLLGLTACGPSILFSGHTPDRTRRVDVLDDSGLQYVAIDGRRTSGYRAVVAWSLTFSDDSKHLAYAARPGRRWVVIADGRHGRAWDGIGEIALATSGRLAYAAQDASAWRVVVDGVPGPRFDAVLSGTLRFSRDGRRIVYVARDRGGVRAVVDGRAGPRWDGIGQLTISDDGAHVAYAARRGAAGHAVVDGVVGPAWRAIGALRLAPVGGRSAYAGLDGSIWRVVVDGEPSAATGRVRSLFFRDDGRHVAWVSEMDGLNVVVLDGAPVAAAEKLRPGTVAFAPARASGSSPGLAHVAPSAGGGEQLIIDGEAGPIYDEVGVPVWSADGRRLAYPARRGPSWLAVVDGRELAGGARVSGLAWSGDGRRLAYLTRRGRDWFAVVDGRSFRFDLVIEDSFAFSRDGASWSVIAGDLAAERLFFAVNGRRRVPLAAREVYSAAAHLARGGATLDGLSDDAAPELLRSWSRAEADRAAREEPRQAMSR
jgi:hypothetical protein